MDISSLSFLDPPSSLLHSPFSDESHLQFYNSRNFYPSKLCFSTSLPRSLSSSRFRPSTCNSACIEDQQTTEQALLKDLAGLKVQMKQKKKELKAQTRKKDIEAKELKKNQKKEKRAMKAQEKKRIKGCSSESSSSSGSESSDCKCVSVSMKMLREGQTAGEDTLRLTNCLGDSGCMSCSVASPTESSAGDSVEIFEKNPSMVSDVQGHVARVESSYRVCSDVDDAGSLVKVTSLSCKDSLTGLLAAAVKTSNRIEVCTGGKCKKVGSEKLLMAFRGQIPGSSAVEAVACKCMGKCGMAMNVRVHKEDTNPQHHSHVGVEDAGLILSHHFGLGRPASGLPSFSLHMRTMPSPLLTV